MTLRLFNLLSICVLSLLFLCPKRLQAQEVEPQSNYSTSEIRYMMRTGFDPTSYNWSKPQINDLVESALHLRRASRSLIHTGFFVFGASSTIAVLNTFRAFGTTRPLTNQETERITAPLVFGFVALCTAIALAVHKKDQAKGKIFAANQIFRPTGRQIRDDDFNDFFKKGL